MFCDLVGSTALASRLDPEDVREVIGTYHECVAEMVGQYEGFVARYMGDGVLVYYGYPQAHEDDAERAVRAGLAQIEAIRHLRTPERLQIRIGIDTGLVVIGELTSSGQAREWDIVGETPNLAARLQALAEPNTVVIGPRTRRLVGNLFEYRDLGAVELKGFAEPLQAHQVLRPSLMESRFEALRSDATELIGRDEELALLVQRWQQTRHSEGRVVLVSGEPGIGKSRLTVALSQTIRDEPHTRLRYFCSPYHQDSALYPFIVQLERTAKFGRDDSIEQKLVKLSGLLVAGARSGEEIELLAELLSLPTAAELNLTPERKREKLFQALLHQFEALARSRPVLMIFEDAQWIDPTSRELLDLTIERVRSLPVLLIVTFRPEFHPASTGQPQVTMLSLSRLAETDGAALVQQLAGNTRLSREIVDEIVERADGVPLFVEELTKAVLESGDRGVAGVLAASPAANRAIPATLHASLIARLDRLGARAKEIAQIGAAIGREFVYDLIEKVAQRPVAELRLGLDRLVKAELLFCRGLGLQSSYLFKHALVQDVAYSTLLRSQRQELHARIAEVLEGHFPIIVDTEPEILAHHLTQASLVEPAIEFWHLSGVRNVRRSAHSEAATHFGCALDLLDKLSPSQRRYERKLELTLALAIPLIAVHGFGSSRVEECALRAKGLSDKLSGSSHRFAAQRVAWNSCLLRQPVPKTVALARDLVRLAHAEDSPARLAVAYRALGYSMFAAGELREASEILDAGTALADTISDHEFTIYGEHPGMVCRLYSGQAKVLMGLPETGTRLIEAAVEHARHKENAHSLAWALGVAAHSATTQHDAEAAARFASEALSTAGEHHLPQWLALGERCMGWAIHQLGDREAGLNLQKQGVKRWKDTGATLHTSHCEVMLVQSFLLESLTTQARAHLDVARAHRASYSENYLAAEIERLEALLLHSEQAAPEQIEGYLVSAFSIARKQEAHLLELRAATTLARILAERGKRHKAIDLLAPVFNWFTEGFDTPDLKEAKALLNELA
jgi:class 3 adenylate cyclase